MPKAPATLKPGATVGKALMRRRKALATTLVLTVAIGTTKIRVKRR